MQPVATALLAAAFSSQSVPSPQPVRAAPTATPTPVSAARTQREDGIVALPSKSVVVLERR